MHGEYRSLCRILAFEEAEADILAIRDAVFGDEQGVPCALDRDGKDPACLHVLATDPAGRPIGTGRLLPDGRIGRLAVLKPWRGRGLGARMLNALVEAARRRGLARVYLHAQEQAVAFYRKQGFAPEGDAFVEAGIRHLNMTLEFKPETP